MKERPILFSGPMVRAILDGMKTQTRRTVKPQPFFNQAGYLAWKTSGCLQNMGRSAETMLASHCPYGQPGDRLWVRETWRTYRSIDNVAPRNIDEGAAIDFLADEWADGHGPLPFDRGKTRPSIHMPRWASRITLEVTGIRVERLNMISEEDAEAEGIERVGGTFSCSPWRNYRKGKPGEMDLHCSARSRSYMTLWESINGPGSWGANPFVWVVEFQKNKFSKKLVCSLSWGNHWDVASLFTQVAGVFLQSGQASYAHR